MFRKRTIPPLILSLMLAGLSNASAQDEEEKKEEEKPKTGIQLRKPSPLFDRRALKVPSRVPQAKGGNKLFESGKAPARKRSSTPAKAGTTPPPPRGRTVTGLGGDIKKTSGKGCVPLRRSDKVQFEFKGAEINDVVAAVSKHLCKNFIITSKVRSQKFDIISPTPITVEEAWQAFLSTLEANDLAMFEVGKYYKIIQATEGTRAPVAILDHPLDETDKTPNDDAVITRIWKVRHGGDPAAIVNYLNIFKSSKGQIHPFVSTNTIIATDFGTSLNRLERIFQEIDQPGILERIHIIPVEFATASEIAEKLSQVFEPQAGKGTPARAKAPTPAPPIAKRVPIKKGTTAPPTPPGEAQKAQGGESVSKILADDRTNKLIIIASEASFKQILALKRQLDVPSEGGEGLVHVLRLKHANAEELASTLSSLAQGRPTTPGRPGRATPTRGKPAAAAPGQGSASLFEGEVKVTADKPTNSLVITASKSDLNSMKRVIASLDVPRYQVFVEAVVLEVSVKRDRTLGMSFFGGVPATIDGQSSPIIFGSNPSQDLNAFSLVATNPLGLASLLGLAGAVRGPPLEGTESIVTGGIPSVGMVLQALKTTNDVNVVSTPHLLTMDNEEAEIQVNEKRPFPSGLSLGGLGNLGALGSQLGGGSAAGALGNLGGLGLGSVSFSREDVGLTLKIKPTINDESYVRLELDQELSDVAGVDQVTGQTITSKRAAKTVVVVGDQESVVIGGLVRDRESTDESKIPLLGDLPILGWLFKRQQKIDEKVNLLLILTPYIIRDSHDFRKIYQRKMDERREFVEAFYGTSEEYRAAIDWDRKLGPVAKFRQGIKDEMAKAENDGPGTKGDVIIRPEDTVLQPAEDSSEDHALEDSDAIAPSEDTQEVTPEEQPPEGEAAPPEDETPPIEDAPPPEDQPLTPGDL